MRCPRCDARIDQTLSRCNHCGQDLEMIKHVYRLSNTYYNIGLERARIRDLSGAIESLKKSLQYNKKNTDARNLLGLVYCEIGETVSALSEWVLSKYLQPDDNAADYYINQIQSNATKLDSINQTIKKYNAALISAKSGNTDLSIIQLKKVVAMNPNFVRALQLLALLYMNDDEYGKAYKCLKQAKKIDTTNTITLRYLKEIAFYARRPSTGEHKNPLTVKKNDPLANVTPIGAYEEEGKNWFLYVEIAIALIVGILVGVFLVRPTMSATTGISAADLSEVKDQLNVKETEYNALNDEKVELEKKVKSLKKKIESGEDGETKYKKLFEGVSLFMENKTTEAAACVAPYKESDYKSEEAKALYKKISKTLTNADAMALFESGRTKCNSGQMDAAIVDLQAALDIDPKSQDALYFMGRCYHKKGDKTKAAEFYNKVLKVSTTTSRASEAKSQLSQLGMTPEPQPTSTSSENN